MKSKHKILFSDSRTMKALDNDCIDLIVTSPPYPMIEMWDQMFSGLNGTIKKKLDEGSGSAAFELMHKQLDRTWKEAYRVLKPGGFVCINIGDATRTIKGNFCLYPNHARILSYTQKLGFSSLPSILWRKQTNAPNKFMGSGMLPAGAYVTLEHEHILILRKGSKRIFRKEEDRKNRRQSAMFWEERNQWFSDIWFDIKGTPQALDDKTTRKRSAAYPFDLAYRLINMYSVKNDIVLDPFLGMGTTTLAAMVSGRNSIGYEIDSSFKITNRLVKENFVKTSQEIIRQRLTDHIEFVRKRIETKGRLKHTNVHYGFPVITAQEKELIINDPTNIRIKDETAVAVNYSELPQEEFYMGRGEFFDKGIKISRPQVLKETFTQQISL